MFSIATVAVIAASLTRLLKMAEPLWNRIPEAYRWVPPVLLATASSLGVAATLPGANWGTLLEAALAGVISGLVAIGAREAVLRSTGKRDDSSGSGTAAGPSGSGTAGSSPSSPGFGGFARIGTAFACAVLLTSLLTSCASSHQAAVRTADVVNQIARTGDKIYVVSVETCHGAEMAAARHPDLKRAETLVAEIRARCDIAFMALERARGYVERIDDAVAKAGSGTLSARDLAALAMSAREAVEAAQDIHVELAKFLKGIK